MVTTPYERLADRILNLSIAKDWHIAKYEWKLYAVYRNEAAEGVCACGKKIINVCVMFNVHTRVFIDVGNCCVKRFKDIDNSSLFNSLRKLRKIENSLSMKVIKLFHNIGVLNKWEYEFYSDTYMKRPTSLSYKQLEKRKSINLKIKEYKTLSKKYQ